MTKRQRRSVAVSLFLAAAMAMALPFFSFGENRTGSEDSDFSELLSEPEIEEFGLEEIEEYLGQNQPEGIRLSFTELAKDILAGDFKQAGIKVGTAVRDGLVSEVGQGSRLLIQVMLLGLVGAVFSGFSGVFSGSQISETGFFVTYLLLFTCLAAGFYQSLKIASDVLNHLLNFMKVLLPAFFLAVAFSGGSISSGALYETTLGMIGIFQGICLMAGLPLIKMYALLVLAGKISREDSISRLTELIGQIVRWGLKTMVGLMMGFQLIQAMVLPSLDAAGQTGLIRMIEAVPGVGQGARSVTQVILGSGVLIKNSIGAAGAVVIGAIAVLPLLKLAVLALLYHGAAALLEPVCDKRVVSCIQGISEAHKLLIHLIWTALLLFAVSLAIVCASTNVTYFAG